MRFIARDVREIMAELGFRTFDEMVGRVEALEINEAVSHWKTRGLDFSNILKKPEKSDGASLRCLVEQQHDFSKTLDFELIEKAKGALAKKTPVSMDLAIRNCNRSVGAMLSSEVSNRYGSSGLPHDNITCRFSGSAGQSFGAFLAKGITFELEGDANDYLGKGLSGGHIILYPPKAATFRPQNNIITGNVTLFGATNGEVFIHGQAGERFAVRNSGAMAVVEGVGDHGCEYMTGGRVIILGRTGVNFAAGMSGGIAYVLDLDQLFDTRCNLEMVELSPVYPGEEAEFLYEMIKKHVSCTGSAYASDILTDWAEMLPQFVKVMPIDYKKALERLKDYESKETELVTVTEEVYN
jgi:glutamate synthase (NADPH/NADH) large chain